MLTMVLARIVVVLRSIALKGTKKLLKFFGAALPYCFIQYIIIFID